jgi:hypothetical protein
MFRFVSSLFGCAHTRCTFPRTITKSGHASTTYVVCLDCGKEFPYDWEKMKVVSSGKQPRQSVA